MKRTSTISAGWHFNWREGSRKHELSWRAAAGVNEGTSVWAYYRALAMRQLGDDAASEALQRLHRYAEKQMDAEVRIDYFATSLPNFLLFDDDLQQRNRIECLFLRGVARLGLGRQMDGEADLRHVLALDQNHMLARLELDRTGTPIAEIAQRR